MFFFHSAGPHWLSSSAHCLNHEIFQSFPAGLYFNFDQVSSSPRVESNPFFAERRQLRILITFKPGGDGSKEDAIGNLLILGADDADHVKVKNARALLHLAIWQPLLRLNAVQIAFLFGCVPVAE
jgi:hypothetical protein